MNFKTQNVMTDGNGDAGLSVRNAQTLFAFSSVSHSRAVIASRASLPKPAAPTGRVKINSVCIHNLGDVIGIQKTHRWFWRLALANCKRCGTTLVKYYLYFGFLKINKRREA